MKSFSDDERSVFMFGVKDFLIKDTDGLLKDLSLQNQVVADLRCLAPSNRTVI